MADRIRINTGRLGADAAQIQGWIRTIAKEVEGIRQSAAALESMWEGSGKEAFQKAFRDDLKTVELAMKSMQEICDYDTNAKKQYEQCDRKVAVLVADLKV
ncbi:MAG: WXG100 family type VII secretion target [Eubacterium sp.]|nr:WXG100 family type VII secretion target [Eubacterium sp.]